jgi:adenylate cyclase
MSQTRRFAAILAADVRRLFAADGADDEGAPSTMKAIQRELSDPKVKEYRGRIVRTTGDGLLIKLANFMPRPGSRRASLRRM